MAAVTVTNTPTRHVIGDLVMRVFNVTGNDLDTLDVGLYGMKNILFAAMMTDYNAVTISGTTLTLNTIDPAFVSCPVMVIAGVG